MLRSSSSRKWEILTSYSEKKSGYDLKGPTSCINKAAPRVNGSKLLFKHVYSVRHV